MRYRGVVFDLFYTLVHPGPYPTGTDRIGWLAHVLQVDAAALRARWRDFEEVLETGRARRCGPTGRSPELAWVGAVAAELGVSITSSMLDTIAADWDRTRRRALLEPPASSVRTLRALRLRGFRLAVLSNTHHREVRVWHRSPLAAMFDAVCFSHEIGVMKPHRDSYEIALRRLGVPAARAVFVGDGGGGELSGARAAGFDLVVCCRPALAPTLPEAPRPAEQAHVTIASVDEIIGLVAPS